ncbi:hypothetical protein ACEWY4_005102 [Coilia grayii]|uniref:Uncharacterized protein n=1 Tax=Coilia grayii TaxID=363190 RepID=A0ABD1KHM5_9TELE
MNEPVCLIDTGQDGRMSVQPAALQILEQIQQPVVVVAVVGLYRTGKSYLMNRLAGRQSGFALGSTIESKTKGIWMWCLPHPCKDGHTLVLLDTEGLGDVEKGDEKHDMWIFCLALLLSSTLVYNSLGTIDNSALEKLQFVTELTEYIRVKSSDHSRNTELMRVFPSFVWTVRDFTLELQLNGKPITADEYLENSLKLKPGYSAEVLQHNLVRWSLKEFFAVRRCFVMDRPASAAKLKRMEQLTDADLEPSFVQQAQQFCSYIHQQAPVKTMRGGRGLTGRMLGSLAETYVEAIRSGKVPCLESAVETLAMIHNCRAVAEALDFYRAEMTQKVQFPTETQEALSSVHSAVAQQAASTFMKASFNDQDEKHLLQLKEGIEKEYGELCKRNVKESRKVCWSVIRRVFASLEHGLSNGSYTRPGGYNDLRSALDHGAQLYRLEKGKGIMSEEVLTEYLEEKNIVGKGICAADQTLSEAQKKMEDYRVRLEEAEQQRRLLEKGIAMQQQAMRDLEQSKQESIRQLERKLEQERQRAQEELQQVLSAKLKEQQELLGDGFEQRAQKLSEEITQLRSERKKSAPFEAVGRRLISWLGKMAFAKETENLGFSVEEEGEYQSVHKTEDHMEKVEGARAGDVENVDVPDVSYDEVHHHHFGQRRCKSCADIAESSHWVLMEPSVSMETGVPVYKHCSPSGRFECAVSGLRWVCASNVTFQYHFSDPDAFRAELAMLQYTPIGPLLDIKVLEGELLEAHLPHFACLEGSESSLKEAVRVLHGVDSAVTLETCELTRFHAKLLKPSFSLTEVLVKIGIPVRSHLDVLIYRMRVTPLTLHIYVVPRDASMIQAVEQDTRNAKKIKKNRPDVSIWMNSKFRLTCTCPAEISPQDITLKYIRPPDFFEVFMENAEERFDLELTCEEQSIWKATMRSVDYGETADTSHHIQMTSAATRDFQGAAFRGQPYLPTSTAGRATGAVGELTNTDLLFRFRLGLIERMSGGVLRDLLDGLQHQLVINRTEAGDILQRTGVQQEQVARLVDTVRNKGRRACGIMLCMLQELDIHLYDDLCDELE